MSLRIAHNIASVNAIRHLGATDNALSMTLERLSSGLRINRAADDPAGLVNARRMSAQVAGLNQAIENSGSAISMVQTAEGALEEVNNILVNMRELALHASNTGANEDAAIAADQDEINSAIATISRIAANTQFGSKFLLNGSAENRATVVAGSVGIQTISNSTLGGGGHTVAVSSTTAAAARYGSTSAASTAGLSSTAAVTISGLNAGTHQVVITAATAAAIESSQALGSQTILQNGTMTITNGSTTGVVTFGTSGGTANTAQNIVNEINADASTNFTASVQQDGSIKIVSNALGGSQAISIAVDGTSITQSMLGLSTLMGANGTTATASLDGGTEVQLDNTANTFTMSDGHGGQMTVTDTITSQAGWQSATLDVSINPATFLVRLDNGATVSMTQGTVGRATSGLATGGSIDLLFNSSVTNGSGTINVVDNSLQFQIGGFADQTTMISIGNIGPDHLGTGVASTSNFTSLAGVDVTSAQKASDSVRIIDAAIADVSRQRATMGSFQSNILESNQNYLRIALENLTAAQSVVEDTDFAAEMSQFTRNQILMQSGTAMLAQANLLPQSVLTLLR